jgi:hypothetical protein
LIGLNRPVWTACHSIGPAAFENEYHQAFAVHEYEVYSFSPERRALQALLQTDHWSSAIDDAARTHGWTHPLVRKDCPHPSAIPLQRIFENEHYAVYRF